MIDWERLQAEWDRVTASLESGEAELARKRQRTAELEGEIEQIKADIARAEQGLRERDGKDALREELMKLGIKRRKDKPEDHYAGVILKLDYDPSRLVFDGEGRVLHAKQEAQRLKELHPEFFTDQQRYGRRRVKSEIEKKAAALKARVEQARRTYNQDVNGLWQTLSNGEKVARYDEGRAREIESRARGIRASALSQIEREAVELMEQVEGQVERALDYSPSAILGSGDRQPPSLCRS